MSIRKQIEAILERQSTRSGTEKSLNEMMALMEEERNRIVGRLRKTLLEVNHGIIHAKGGAHCYDGCEDCVRFSAEQTGSAEALSAFDLTAQELGLKEGGE